MGTIIITTSVRYLTHDGGLQWAVLSSDSVPDDGETDSVEWAKTCLIAALEAL